MESVQFRRQDKGFDEGLDGAVVGGDGRDVFKGWEEEGACWG